MNIKLTLHETRVIGCLIEKEITTPEQYPLSLNALTNACNQRRNRDPALDLGKACVQQVVDSLIKKHHVNEHGPFVVRLPREPGKRESRYTHLFSGEVTGAEEDETALGFTVASEKSDTAGGRLGQLERRVADLEAEVAALKRLVG